MTSSSWPVTGSEGLRGLRRRLHASKHPGLDALTEAIGPLLSSLRREPDRFGDHDLVAWSLTLHRWAGHPSGEGSDARRGIRSRMGGGSDPVPSLDRTPGGVLSEVSNHIQARLILAGRYRRRLQRWTDRFELVSGHPASGHAPTADRGDVEASIVRKAWSTRSHLDEEPGIIVIPPSWDPFPGSGPGLSFPRVVPRPRSDSKLGVRYDCRRTGRALIGIPVTLEQELMPGSLSTSWSEADQDLLGLAACLVRDHRVSGAVALLGEAAPLGRSLRQVSRLLSMGLDRVLVPKSVGSIPASAGRLVGYEDPSDLLATFGRLRPLTPMDPHLESPR